MNLIKSCPSPCSDSDNSTKSGMSYISEKSFRQTEKSDLAVKVNNFMISGMEECGLVEVQYFQKKNTTLHSDVKLSSFREVKAVKGLSAPSKASLEDEEGIKTMNSPRFHSRELGAVVFSSSKHFPKIKKSRPKSPSPDEFLKRNNLSGSDLSSYGNISTHSTSSNRISSLISQARIESAWTDALGVDTPRSQGFFKRGNLSSGDISSLVTGSSSRSTPSECSSLSFDWQSPYNPSREIFSPAGLSRPINEGSRSVNGLSQLGSLRTSNPPLRNPAKLLDPISTKK